MKHVLTILSILFISSGLIAQDKSKFQSAMAGTLKKMAASKTAEEYQAVANTFGRIADNEKDEWAPVYYKTFIKTFQAFEAKDKAAAASELELLTGPLVNLLNIEKVKEDPKVSSEIQTLIAMVFSARMMENPMVLGAKFAPVSAEYLQKAIALNKDNPRAYLLQAQSLAFTPEAFGGDKKKAKKLSELAMELFMNEAENEATDFMPRWGQGQVTNLLKQLNPTK